MDAAGQVLEVVKAGNVSSIKQLLDSDPSLVNSRDEMGNSAILLALYYGHHEVARILVARGANLNLFEASAAGAIQRVKTLLGSNPSLIYAYSHDGFTALHLAAFFGHLAVVEYLLTQKPDVNAVAQNPMQVTALHSAVANSQQAVALAVVSALVAAGASVNAKQTQGFTALHGAAQSGYVDLIRFLLDHGADKTLATDDGKTARDIALESGQSAAAELL